jgi:hypothetical protein
MCVIRYSQLSLPSSMLTIAMLHAVVNAGVNMGSEFDTTFETGILVRGSGDVAMWLRQGSAKP